MRDQVNLGGRDTKYILEYARRVLAHHNQTIRPCGDLPHYVSLIRIRLMKNGMERCDYRHGQVPQQLQNMAASFSPKDPVLVLQTHQIDMARIEKLGGCPVGR
jgi:hypothetical protein